MAKYCEFSSIYAYNQRERNWFDAMIDARNAGLAFSWI